MTGLLEKAKDNVQKVYEAGKKAEYDAFWDGLQENGARKSYNYAFCGRGWNSKTLKPKHMMTLSGATNMFMRCNECNPERLDMTEICKKIDASNVTNAAAMFQDAFLENVTIDLGNATTIQNIFNASNDGSQAILSVTIKVTEKCTNFSNAFAYCGKTGKIIFTEDSVIASNGLNLQRSTLLSKESIVSVINALSTTTTGLTVTLSKTAVNNAFGIKVDNETTWTDEWVALKNSKANWTIKLV